MRRLFLSVILSLIFMGVADAQRRMVLHGESYPKADTVQYYLPSSLQDGERYPLVVLLHGYGGSFRQWPSIANLQYFSDEFRFIIACPDGFKDSWYIDSPLKKGENYATFFRETIIRTLRDSLPVDASMMFISGLSMGGHGALRLFMENHEMFRAAGSMSGVMDLTASSVTASIAKHLGKKSADNTKWKAYSNVYNIDRLKAAGKPIIVNCGSQDFLIEANRKFAKACAEEGIDIVYMESPGKHEKSYWALILPEQLRFFNKFVNKN
ncbi:MAG: prolyl oligopeptidase family serine peptidase [Bacteroidales bacterium]|nr:prolyl oligopeptidase family serine peptidase [Bacteroidales bacterium]